MRIGIVSDIHSNRHALDAVLDAMPDVDTLVCCGDIVGYNAHPRYCVETIREQADVIVQGNHDRAARSPETYSGHAMAYEGLRHTQEQLSDDQLDWLTSLNKTATYNQYRVVHSHPTNTGQYVYPRDFPRMRSELDDDQRGMFLGHTHVQHEAVVDGRLIVNPGSVGQPRDGDPDAAFAVLDTEANEITLKRTEYDVEGAQSDVRAADLPERTAARLSSGE